MNIYNNLFATSDNISHFLSFILHRRLLSKVNPSLFLCATYYVYFLSASIDLMFGNSPALISGIISSFAKLTLLSMVLLYTILSWWHTIIIPPYFVSLSVNLTLSISNSTSLYLFTAFSSCFNWSFYVFLKFLIASSLTLLILSSSSGRHLILILFSNSLSRPSVMMSCKNLV